ncbi:MAG: preprotein translocase subunit SecE [Candidatus Paceibacterota bacterium]
MPSRFFGAANIEGWLFKTMMGRIQRYFVESWSELKKVNWPTREQTIRLTTVVVGLSLAVAVFLGVLDILFAYGLAYFIAR